MERYISYIINSEEQRLFHEMALRGRDPESPTFGGLEGDTVDVKRTCFSFARAAALWTYRESSFYEDEKLLDVMREMLYFIRRLQLPGGLFDFTVCNFISAPDTCFAIHPLIRAYHLLDKLTNKNDEKDTQKSGEAFDVYTQATELKHSLLEIFVHAGYGIAAGGFHTPNHRWAICSILSELNKIFSSVKQEEIDFINVPETVSNLLELQRFMTSVVQQYLAEGIDGNADGEYAERSAGNYNGVVNTAMLSLADSLQDSSYIGFVERNLAMMEYYFESDDTIFTMNSTRQDHGKVLYPDQYFMHYLRLSDEPSVSPENRGVFDAAAYKIITDCIRRGVLAPVDLAEMLLCPSMLQHTFKVKPGFIQSYRREFKDSGVFRCRKERYSYTLLKDKSGFLYFRSNAFEICMKIGESFCEVRNFIPQSMEIHENGCTLSSVKDVWYYKPWKEADRPNTSDWWKMDNGKREKYIPVSLRTVVDIQEMEDGLEIHLHTEGLEHLPLRVQLWIPSGTTLENENFHLIAQEGGSMLLKQGNVLLKKEERIVEFFGGFGEHTFKGHYSGEETNQAGFTLLCNGITPVDKVMKLRVLR